MWGEEEEALFNKRYASSYLTRQFINISGNTPRPIKHLSQADTIL